MSKRKSFYLPEEQAEHVEQHDNQSEYIQRLIREDAESEEGGAA